ncbi:cytochrome c oxidase assembly protein [Dokdonella sp.]|uniref:cytochrome c oxidase assembly protein n=1 Tax=Dokdonella sp. TaxID=2291710 RepID=UPI0025BD04D5|nr:cytochrome c oxidase assembly protein [Dokdonella sp.]MBX3689101.1 cytochrome c oxidase assembly protein [Dokdonella sp.]
MNAAVNHHGVLKTALIVVACAFVFGFAMVPVYRIVCEHVFGIRMSDGAVAASDAAALVEDASRTITVQFVANVNSKLPWDFAPERPSMQVHPGKIVDAWFDATNTGKQAIVGNAVPSVAPAAASAFFNKTECFCFTEQVLAAGETRRMPVRFFVDPRLPKDVRELTLSYTFYANEVATQRLLETGSPQPAAG